jgi:hypothetical protein
MSPGKKQKLYVLFFSNMKIWHQTTGFMVLAAAIINTFAASYLNTQS